MLNPRRVLSKGQILQNVWRYDFGGNANVVETYVSYLRRKLDAGGPPLIKTVRQAGYMLEGVPCARLSLRARLLLAVISLAAAGLVVANVVTFTVAPLVPARPRRPVARRRTRAPSRGPGGDAAGAPPGVAVPAAVGRRHDR